MDHDPDDVVLCHPLYLVHYITSHHIASTFGYTTLALCKQLAGNIAVVGLQIHHTTPTQSQHLYLGLDMGDFSCLEQCVVGPQKSLLLLYSPLSSSQLAMQGSQLTLVPLLKLSSGLLNQEAISQGHLLQVHILSV